MLLNLRRGFRVLSAHVAAVGGAGCQRRDAAAGRSRSSALAEREARYDEYSSDLHGMLDAPESGRMSSTQQQTSVLMTRQRWRPL